MKMFIIILNILIPQTKIFFNILKNIEYPISLQKNN